MQLIFDSWQQKCMGKDNANDFSFCCFNEYVRNLTLTFIPSNMFYVPVDAIIYITILCVTILINLLIEHNFLLI